MYNNVVSSREEYVQVDILRLSYRFSESVKQLGLGSVVSFEKAEGAF